MGGRVVHLEWFERRGPRAGSRDAQSSDEGLRFGCTMCGACCTGPEGYVLLTDDEASAMATELGLPEPEFRERFTRTTSLGLSLDEHETEHGFDCVFLDRESVPGKAVCGVYGARPAQCRTWPFWKSNLSSERAWQRASSTCPGIDRGKLHPVETIVTRRDVVDI